MGRFCYYLPAWMEMIKIFFDKRLGGSIMSFSRSRFFHHMGFLRISKYNAF